MVKYFRAVFVPDFCMFIQRVVWRDRHTKLGSLHIWVGALVVFGVILESEVQRAH